MYRSKLRECTLEVNLFKSQGLDGRMGCLLGLLKLKRGLRAPWRSEAISKGYCKIKSTLAKHLEGEKGLASDPEI